jgi:hypothetical protein
MVSSIRPKVLLEQVKTRRVVEAEDRILRKWTIHPWVFSDGIGTFYCPSFCPISWDPNNRQRPHKKAKHRVIHKVQQLRREEEEEAPRLPRQLTQNLADPVSVAANEIVRCSSFDPLSNATFYHLRMKCLRTAQNAS